MIQSNLLFRKFIILITAFTFIQLNVACSSKNKKQVAEKTQDSGVENNDDGGTDNENQANAPKNQVGDSKNSQAKSTQEAIQVEKDPAQEVVAFVNSLPISRAKFDEEFEKRTMHVRSLIHI